MKKKNLKPMIISALLATGFAATSVGTSFALFTDKAETKITVQSGVVSVDNEISVLNVKELNNVAVVENAGVFESSIGSKTSIDESTGEVKLEKWVPGDKAEFEVVNSNASNVAIKTRFTVKKGQIDSTKPNLADVLKVTYEVTSGTDSPINQTNYRKWTQVASEVTELTKIKITIEFPDSDNGVINFESSDNAYQDGNATFLFTQEAVQGNAVVEDETIVWNYYVSPDPTVTPYRKNNYDELETLDGKSWLHVIGTADLPNHSWQLNTETNLLEKPGDVGMARAGDIVHLAPGEYYAAGKVYLSAGVTLIGAGSEVNPAKGSWFDVEMVCLNGDVHLKNLSLLNHTAGYIQHILQPNTTNLSGDSHPSRTEALNEMYYLIDLENVRIQGRDGYAEKLCGISCGPKIQLDIKNCIFKDLDTAIGSVSKNSAESLVSIKNTTFDHTGEALGAVGSTYITNSWAEDLCSNQGNVGLVVYSDTLETASGKLISSNYGNYQKCRSPFTYDDLSNVVRIY